ncbi:acyltransferase [Sphingobium sp. PNB]|uniref:acyltransferase family protein n=1 Tax=Sphingobium sp. PNB TaxID=863934 RepID=UPI001CA46650|nr:acyltransferase [Sphingobium sp. PNB]MCB4858048.1 acyltransferase [Sphingobium sp. PNB]
MSGRHIPALDGLRGFAALIVMLSHFPDVGLPPWVNHRLGDYGVMLFFVLSGFLMGHLYLGQKPDVAALLRYGAARAGRILPLYLAVSLLSFFLFSYADPAFIYRIDGQQLLRLLSFTSAQPIFWSIGPEFQFYFLFPLVWMAFHSSRPNRPVAFLALATAICLSYAVSSWTPGFSVFAKLHIFIAGIGTALLMKAAPPRPPLAMLVLGSALAFLAAILLSPAWAEPFLFPSTRGDPKHIGYYGDLAKVLLCACVIHSATIDHRLNDWLWGNGAMRRLGAWSFSLYLLHMPAFYLAGYLPMPPAPRAVASLLLAVGIAALSHRFVEGPANHCLRRLLARLFDRQPKVILLPDLSRAEVRR